MKRDIRTRQDIELLISSFYGKVKTDPIIGNIFTEVFTIHWEKHLPIMYDFWENTLFYTGTYSGNPMEIHRSLHRKYPLREEHFKRWIWLFTSTVDELFSGEKALLCKQRALSISAVMRLKILGEKGQYSQDH